jgi:DNA-binding transcriptional LysR family regulator
MPNTSSSAILKMLDMLLKHGNFTKAAKELYISQPYLTQTIKKLEHSLEIEIINRKVTPLQLTEAGKIYFEYLRNQELQTDKLRRRLAMFSENREQSISIGVLPSLGSYLLPRFIPEFKQSHPEVRIDLSELLPEDNEKKALNGEIDFFIGQNPETISPLLTTHVVGNHGYYAIIPENSRFYEAGATSIKSGTIDLQELLLEDFVLTKSGSAIRRQTDYLFQKYHLQPQILAETIDIFTMVELAKKGLGVAIVPETVPVNRHKGDRFNTYKLPKSLLSLKFFIGYQTDKELSVLEQELINRFVNQK